MSDSTEAPDKVLTNRSAARLLRPKPRRAAEEQEPAATRTGVPDEPAPRPAGAGPSAQEDVRPAPGDPRPVVPVSRSAHPSESVTGGTGVLPDDSDVLRATTGGPAGTGAAPASGGVRGPATGAAEPPAPARPPGTPDAEDTLSTGARHADASAPADAPSPRPAWRTFLPPVRWRRRPPDAPDPEVTTSTGARHADASAPADAPSPRPAWRTFLHPVRWRTLAVVLAVLAVAVWVGRGVIGSSGGDAEPSAGNGGAEAAAEPPPEPVVVDGQQIAPAGSLITLNPAVAQPGAAIAVDGAGFDPGATVDLAVSPADAPADQPPAGEPVGSAETDENGGFTAQVTLPEQLATGNVVVTAQQRESDKTAQAEAVATAGTGSVSLSEETGQPGDVISVTASGFTAGETIDVFWGRVSGDPSTTLTAGEGGNVDEAQVRVGTGTVGQNTLVLVGEESGTTATAAFFLNGLYPTSAATPYAVKARQVLTLSGEGFAPQERVLVYVNASSGTPLLTAQADGQGSFGGVGFEVPYGLSGANSLVMIGELSRATTRSGFEILPYTPSAGPSTYGGAPGTTFGFFAEGFGPEEVVLVYLGRNETSEGELVTAFQVDERGEAGPGGSFQVDGSDQGTLSFTLVGRDSGGQTTVEFEVSAPTGPVDDVPERGPYTLPPELDATADTPQGDQPPEGAPPEGAAPPEGTPPEGATPPEDAPQEPAAPSEGGQ